ncbi:MAG: hypothetical protein EOP84_05905 [Verrucomicrobiaceae bacterium]|nr:MAG: hypothetical protein EOP84_05905 [Verrucomicrobiaceae bacterium]
MNEEPFTPSGVTTAEAQTGVPMESGSPLQSKARQTAQSVKSEAQNLKGAARDQGAAAIDQVKAGVQSATHQAQEAGRSFILNQKESLASKVSQYADAARSASQCLSGGETNMLAEPARKAADQLERVSSFLRDTDPADMFEEVEAFTRRRPEIVFGGLFIAGLAAARFLKASGERARDRRILRGSEWQPRAYSTPEESIIPASSTPVIPSIPPAPVTTPPLGSTSPGVSSSPGISTKPGLSATGGDEDCGCSTFPKP